MMLFEPEEREYKTLEIITFEEFKDDILEGAIGQRVLIDRYRTLIETGANPEKSEDYAERIERYAHTIIYNLSVLERAEIERDYLIFYREDGHVGIQPGNPTHIKRVYERERSRRGLVV